MNEAKELRKVFAKNLKYWANIKGKTKSGLAKDLKLPDSTVSDWFNEKNYPRIETLQKLADYFGIKKSDLIEGNADIIKIKEEVRTLYFDLKILENKLIELRNIDNIDVIQYKIKELLGEKE